MFDTSGPHTVGKAQVYPDRNLIRIGLSEQRISGKAMAVLCELMRQPGTVIRREALLDAVWGRGRGSDELLNNAVSKLRKALADSGDDDLLETIPKIGYRLQHSPSARAAQHWKLAAVATLVIAVFAFGAFDFTQSQAGHASASSKAPLVTSAKWQSSSITRLPGLELRPRYSPDGSSLLFAWIRIGTTYTDLYRLDLESGQIQQLTDDKRLEVHPAWSSDAQRIAYLSVTRAGDCRIMILHVDDTKRTRELPCAPHRPTSLDWSPNADALVFDEYDPVRHTSKLWELDIGSGISQRLELHKEAAIGRLPSYHPDGKRIAWVAESGHTDQFIVLDLVNGMLDRTPAPTGQVLDIEWAGTGEFIAAVRLDDQTTQLWQIGAKRSELLQSFDQIVTSVTRHPNTGALAFDFFSGSRQLMAASLENGQVSRFAPSTFADEHPVVIAGSEEISFHSNRSGRYGLWRVHVSKPGKPQLLFSTELPVRGHDWSADGGRIAYSTGSHGSRRLWVFDLSSGEHSVLSPVGQDAVFPQWSADGDSVYYVDHAGSDRLMALDLPSMKSSVLLDHRIAQYRISGNGILISLWDQPGLWRVDMTDQSLRQVNDSVSEYAWALWTHSHNKIYRVAINEGRPVLLAEDLEGKLSARLWLPNFANSAGPNLAFMPSGNVAIIATDDNYQGNIERLEIVAEVSHQLAGSDESDSSEELVSAL